MSRPSRPVQPPHRLLFRDPLGEHPLDARPPLRGTPLHRGNAHRAGDAKAAPAADDQGLPRRAGGDRSGAGRRICDPARGCRGAGPLLWEGPRGSEGTQCPWREAATARPPYGLPQIFLPNQSRLPLPGATSALPRARAVGAIFGLWPTGWRNAGRKLCVHPGKSQVFAAGRCAGLGRGPGPCAADLRCSGLGRRMANLRLIPAVKWRRSRQVCYPAAPVLPGDRSAPL